VSSVCARAGVQRERYGRKPSASCASHLPGVPQGNALHRLKVRPSHVPVRPMRRRRSHAIVRRTCLDERRIAAAETAMRSLVSLIGTRHQSSSSLSRSKSASGSSRQASAGSSCRWSSVVPRIRLCVATRPYRRIIDDHRKAGRPLRRYVRARVRAALLYRATPSAAPSLGTRPHRISCWRRAHQAAAQRAQLQIKSTVMLD
jgi:hypothetical protein